MKSVIVLALAMFLGLQAANAQNLGESYDWLKDSYKKIPMKASMPYYDVTVPNNGISYEKLTSNAKYFAENVLHTDDIAELDGKGITLNGSYDLYTNDKKDEEHTYKVNYKIDIQVKGGKYIVAMHDFNIFFLNNKVEFGLKYKGAKQNDGKSNQFMAIFHTLNERQIKKLCETMTMEMLPADATASN